MSEISRVGMVGLSFDDGPNAENTLPVLNTLGQHKAQATLFWLVDNARALKKEDPPLFAEVMDKVRRDGHEIGYHGPSDFVPTFRDRTIGRFNATELRNGREELEEIIEQPVALYRPHFVGGLATMIHAAQMGLTIIAGDATAFALPDDDIEHQIERFSQANERSIIVFHDGTSATTPQTHITKVLPPVLETLARRGLKFTKVSSLGKYAKLPYQLIFQHFRR
ncbi:MAG TPA: polysaccharide deacetylase family protein [Candidatus Saccharimonadales bacterium]|nr:polysaccharide deacetylase family protein [Candidatus Saccharimonadales bacterium]